MTNRIGPSKTWLYVAAIIFIVWFLSVVAKPTRVDPSDCDTSVVCK